MGTFSRRDAIKALGATAVATAVSTPAVRAAPEYHVTPEKGANLKFLRWKTFVQSDEDQWLANTRKFTEQTGIQVVIENVNVSDITAKAHMAPSVGAGPGLAAVSVEDRKLYPEQCLDLAELATYLRDKYGGWYETCRRYCTADNRWLALGLAFYPYQVVYRDSMVKAAGFSEIPQDLTGFLKLCQALKARGPRAGLTLGNAYDAHAWCYWLIWAHGGRLVDEDNHVAINSRETIAALEYANALYQTFIPGTLSWLDPSNNKAFLAGEISLTYNPV